MVNTRLALFDGFATGVAGPDIEEPERIVSEQASQAAFSTVFSAPDINTTTTFAPVGTLDILLESSFTALKHPEFPGYGVRIKKSNFCDEGVGAHHLFFYFFESKSDPDTDDVIFWTNGGPGCSSGIGLLMEVGPCRVVTNLFFVDQLIGSTTEDAAQEIAAFVAIFFAHFSKFQGRGFHMSGESYAIPRCTKWVKESCVDQFDLINCSAAEAFCGNVFMSPYIATEDVQVLLGVDGSKSESSSDTVGVDQGRQALRHCAARSRRPCAHLLYAGTYDFAGQAEFGDQPLAEWAVDGKRAGRTRYTKGLTFATVDGAGHMVPRSRWKCGSLDSRCELVSAISLSRHPTLGTLS
ncbi:protease S10 [Mycena albidolilacea]|uniref:carboxypeptidase C n=1 Tax=Mycena albidolilacea TaxID=1033008 RepID=A0AAD6Z1U3_9AGAR|nr:protease S10 [Mycena albidolilacea]